jgi:hypothetical protein
MRELHTRVLTILETGDARQAATLAEQVSAALAAEELAVAAAARRAAVLKGLASLGYEVAEGMGTAWVEKGRVVLRHAARPGYGVEVGGGVQAARVQMRAVALAETDAPRDQARDLDAETIWCGEFARLRELLAKKGDTLTIERAQPVGATPLKVIVDAPAAAHYDDVMSPRLREK